MRVVLLFQRYEVSVATATSPALTRLPPRLLVSFGHLGEPGPGDVLAVLLQNMGEIGRLFPVGSEKCGR